MQKILSLIAAILIISSASAQDIPGCTNPESANYNPEATIDDGSCCSFENWSTLYTNSNTYIHIWGVTGGNEFFIQTTADIPYSFCLPIGCYLFEAFGSNPAISTNITIEKNGYIVLEASSVFTNLSGNFSANSTSGCPDINACNYDPNTACPDWTTCTYDCQGCTDPLADNYDPEALIENGTCCYNLLSVQVEGEGENSWYVSNSLTYYADGGSYNENYELCLYDGCYFINMYTANPNTPFSVVDNDGLTVVSGITDDFGYGLVEFGENIIPGCTDQSACNYTSEANCLDYSMCDYSCYGCTDPTAPNFNTEATIENGTCCYNNYYTIEISADAYWSAGLMIPGSYYYLSGLYPTNNWFCLPDGCFQISVYSLLPEQVSFTVYNANGSVFYSGTTDEFGQASINFTDGEVYGCTDFNACNYDPLATCTDWFACNYDCYGCTDPTAPNFDPTATIDNGTCCVNDWYTMEMSGPGYFLAFNNSTYNYAGGNYPEESGFCMNNSCFAIQVYSYDLGIMNFTLTNEAGEIVFQGATNENGYFLGTISINNEIAGCTDMNACNYNPNATCNSGLCEYYCGGCTDPTAMNYNAYAWYDDGTCFYTIEPPMMQLQTETLEAEEVYYVRMDVMSVGNGAPYVMMNSINNEMNMIEENGQYYAGPFPCGESVSISLHSAEYGMMEYVVTDPLEGACSVTSVENMESTNSLSSFPNPSNGLFTITGIDDGNWQIRVTDVTGRSVYSNNATISNGRHEMNLSDLSAGQYQITFFNSLQALTTRITLQQ